MKLNKLFLIILNILFLFSCSVEHPSKQHTEYADKYLNKIFKFDNREYIITNIIYYDDSLYRIKATTSGNTLYLSEDQINLLINRQDGMVSN